jgi:hypothetical protein
MLSMAVASSSTSAWIISIGGVDAANARCRGKRPSFVRCLAIETALPFTSFMFGLEFFIQLTTVVSVPKKKNEGEKNV